MKRTLFLALSLLASGAGRPFAWSDPVEDAQQAYADGDFAKAAKLYTQAAKKGVGDAQYNLGVMYFNGQGVAQDYPEALQWFKKAAAHKIWESYYYIGVIYDNGSGVPPDPAEAAKWYRKAAEKKEIKAERKLARLYQDGKGVSQDFESALQWYRKAAEKNDAEAEFGLGTMYEAGQGVERDYSQASDWYALALQGGHPEAKDRLEKLKVLVAQEALVKIQNHVTHSTSPAQPAPTSPSQQPSAPAPVQDNLTAWGPDRWAAVGAGCLALVLIPAIIALRRKERQKNPPPPAPAAPAKKKIQPAADAGFRTIEDQTLLNAVHREIEVLRHCRHYSQAGQVSALVAQCAGKPPEFCSAYAEAFLKLNDYRGALDLLEAKSALTPDDYSVYIAAHFRLGKMDMLEPSQIPEKGKAAFAVALMEAGKDREAKEALLENRQGAPAAEDFAAVFRLALRLGDIALAGRYLEDISKSPGAPGLSYLAALLCEKNGRLDLAQTLYKNIGGFKDSAGRLRRLQNLPEDDVRRLAAVMEVFAGSPESPLTRAFSEHFVGRYELSRPLGVGSTGVLFKGSDRAVTRDAAVKKFAADLAADEKARAFFLRQAELAAKVSSPYLANVFDAVTVSGSLFLACAYVDGESLSEIMAQRGRFPPKKLLPLLKSACEGVVAVHEGKVIHGNIKPSNILVERNGGVKVTDLGFSQLAGRKYEGMPYYGAPELASGAPTAQSDIYSMGLTACELLTGEAPPAEAPGYVARFSANKELLETAEGKGLHGAIMDCLKAEPAARPRTMGQLMSRLQGI